MAPTNQSVSKNSAPTNHRGRSSVYTDRQSTAQHHHYHPPANSFGTRFECHPQLDHVTSPLPFASTSGSLASYPTSPIPEIQQPLSGNSIGSLEGLESQSLLFDPHETPMFRMVPSPSPTPTLSHIAAQSSTPSQFGGGFDQSPDELLQMASMTYFDPRTNNANLQTRFGSITPFHGQDQGSSSMGAGSLYSSPLQSPLSDTMTSYSTFPDPLTISLSGTSLEIPRVSYGRQSLAMLDEGEEEDEFAEEWDLDIKNPSGYNDNHTGQSPQLNLHSSSTGMMSTGIGTSASSSKPKSTSSAYQKHQNKQKIYRDRKTEHVNKMREELLAMDALPHGVNTRAPKIMSKTVETLRDYRGLLNLFRDTVEGMPQDIKEVPNAVKDMLTTNTGIKIKPTDSQKHPISGYSSQVSSRRRVAMPSTTPKEARTTR